MFLMSLMFVKNFLFLQWYDEAPGEHKREWFIKHASCIQAPSMYLQAEGFGAMDLDNA